MNTIESQNIQNFENWMEISKGYYRYVVAANACYELMVIRKESKTGPDLYSLYVTGEWRDGVQSPYFERKCLRHCKTLSECLKKAANDYESNLKNNDPFKVTKANVEEIRNYILSDYAPDADYVNHELKIVAKMVIEMYEKMNNKGE